MLTRISNQKVDGLGEQIVDKGVYFIRQRSEMEAGAPWATPDMFDRTCQIMERCDLTFKREGYLFPHFNLRADPDWPAFEAQSPKA
jgi:DNA polymerase III alpha subunit